jgi:hypothetical protein
MINRLSEQASVAIFNSEVRKTPKVTESSMGAKKRLQIHGFIESSPLQEQRPSA